MRGRAQRVVDLDRQVRAEPGRTGHPPVRERRRRFAAHVLPQLGGHPAADARLHRLLADAQGLGQRAQRPARLGERRQRRRQQLAAPRRPQLPQPAPPTRIGHHRGAHRSRRVAGVAGTGCPVPSPSPRALTYWRRPWVTTSDIVRPSRARRAFRRRRCSASSRKVSSGRRGPGASPVMPAAALTGDPRARRSAPGAGAGHRTGSQRRRARPPPGPGTGASRRRACAGSSRAGGP